jgi:dsRNA-specific ribonuclease
MLSVTTEDSSVNPFPLSSHGYQNLIILRLLQALTSASANDIVNLERMETLGDSFLKLMSSLYLFKHHKCMNEGELTYYKGKHIGNRNLYYCGVNRGLGGLMKVCCGYAVFCK